MEKRWKTDQEEVPEGSWGSQGGTGKVSRGRRCSDRFWDGFLKAFLSLLGDDSSDFLVGEPILGLFGSPLGLVLAYRIAEKWKRK